MTQKNPQRKPRLTIELLRTAAGHFSKLESRHKNRQLYGVTDGKAVGTYLEQKFQAFLAKSFVVDLGCSANGIDLPTLGVDIKVTSIKQPQSSCPFKSARQKIYGLGYHLLLFVYQKQDDDKQKESLLNILHGIFISAERTADYQMTRQLLEVLDGQANKDDIVALFHDRNLPIDDIEASQLAQEVLKKRPNQGYLTISNALQWRLQYGRIVEVSGQVDGIFRLWGNSDSTK